MNDDKTITQQDIDEASVRLRPILGVAPARYLAVLYGAAILAAAFLLLVFPGIRKPGTTWSFVADPPGSAVYVDGVYLGYAPCSVFVAAGKRTVTVTRPGFETLEQSIVSDGRVFGTLVVRPRASLAVSLRPLPGTFTLEDGMRRYASWALSGSPSEAYQIPMVLSDAARAASMAPGAIDARGLAGAAAAYAVNAPSFRDGIRAVSIAYGRSAALTPASLGRLVATLASDLRDDPSIFAVLASFAPESARTRLEASSAYRTLVSTVSSAVAASSPSAGPSSFVAGEEFVTMEGGTAVIKAGSTLSAAIPVAPYRIAASETTVGRFRRFVEARPEWGPGAATALAARGLAEADYLEGFADASADDPVRFVSRPAALAYCAWLSATAPEGYRFDLPGEAQWSYAAAVSGASASRNAVLSDLGASAPASPSSLTYDDAGLKGMLGNVWEWCSDSYAAHPASGVSGRARFPSEEGVVRGGSFANRSDLVNLASRGPMRETECSAYLGFRVVLVAETE